MQRAPGRHIADAVGLVHRPRQRRLEGPAVPGVRLARPPDVQVDELVEQRLQHVPGPDPGIGRHLQPVFGRDREADPVRSRARPPHLQLRPPRQRAVGEDRQPAQAVELLVEAHPGDEEVGRRALPRRAVRLPAPSAPWRDAPAPRPRSVAVAGAAAQAAAASPPPSVSPPPPLSPPPARNPAGFGLELVRFDHPVDQPVLTRLFRLEEFVAFHVEGDLLDRLAGVFDVDVVQPVAQLEHLAGVDLDVGGLAFEPARGLVDEDAAVRQRHPFAFRAAGEDQRPGRHRDPVTDGLHVGLDELHRVVDRQARVGGAAGRVDVEADVLVRIVGLEVEQLGDDQVGEVLGHLLAEEDDPLRQQAAVDVEGALAASGLFDDHRDQWHMRLSFSVPAKLALVLRNHLVARFPSLAECATIKLRIRTRDERSSPMTLPGAIRGDPQRRPRRRRPPRSGTR